MNRIMISLFASFIVSIIIYQMRGTPAFWPIIGFIALMAVLRQTGILAKRRNK